MKTLKTMAAVVAAILAGIVLTGCTARTDTTTAANQTTAAQRGNLNVDISSSGNLEFSNIQDLSFGMAGTVDQVSVDVGDSVAAGQELVRLDTTSWDNQLEALQRTLTVAQRNLTTAQRQVISKQLAVRQAGLNLESAENDLKQIADVKTAQDAIDTAQNNLNIAQAMLQAGASPGASYWIERVTTYRDLLASAKKELQDVLNGSSVKLTTNAALQVAKAQLTVEQSQMQLEDAQIAVDTANSAADDAQQALDDAQQALDDAKSLSPIIKAPFAGYVTKLSVTGGQEIKKGTVAVSVAESGKFQANIMVSESDVNRIRVGDNATVQTSATSLSFPAKVTRISPTATIQSGVVNYQTTVELLSTMPMLMSNNGTSQFSSMRNTQGQPRSGQGGQSSSNQTGQRQFQIGQNQQSSSNQTGPGQFQLGQNRPSTSNQTVGQLQLDPARVSTALSAIQPRQGLTVSVNVRIDQRSDVLMVPNRAITRQQGQTYVTTIDEKGTTQQVQVTIGINNSQYTEITSGLTEGQKVTVSTASATSSNSQQPSFFRAMPGGGLMR